MDAPCQHGLKITGDTMRNRVLRVGLLLVCSANLLLAQATGPDHGTASQPSPFSEAEALIGEGRLTEAEEEVRNQLSAHPSSVDGYNLLGIIYADQKGYAKSIEAFRHAVALNPASTKSRNNLANAYVSAGQLDAAAQEFRSVLRNDPQNRDANYNLAVVLLAKGSPSAAILYLQRIRPANKETRLQLIRANLEAHRTHEALRLAREVSNANDRDVQLHFTLGVLLASEKQYRAAEVEFQKADSLQPDSVETLHNLAQAYLRDREYTQAEGVLNRILKLKPDSPEDLYLLAQVYSEQSRPLDALDLLVRAHNLAPENTDIIFLLARVSMLQNYFEDAIPLLQSGLKIAPNRADLRAALGESFFMSGKTEKAIEEFTKLIEVDPSAASYAFMGLAYRHLGRFDEAKRYFQEGLRKDPRNASCLFNLGFIEERQGNHAVAEKFFIQALQSNPEFAEALLELANLRVQSKQLQEAADLLKKYVRVSREPAQGYYKLAMVERRLHQLDAAQRDLQVFQTLSKDSASGPYPYQHLFEYLENRSKLTPIGRTQLDLAALIEQTKRHPDRPQDLYLLAETYLKLGNIDEAKKAIAQLDALSAADYRTQTGVGVLLARHHLYADAVEHFQAALRVKPDSDDARFDLAAALFRQGSFEQALEAAQQVSAAGQNDDAFLTLLGDIYAHLRDANRAGEIFENAIARNPDNDQCYLSLAMVQLRQNDLSGAEKTLKRGRARIPASGKIAWGLGLVAVQQGRTDEAAKSFERAVDLLPEWAGSYSTLGVFYYQTGQITKAREVLDRFRGSNAGGLDVNRIEQALSRAPQRDSNAGEPLPMEARQRLLQLALTIADRTL